MLTNTVTDFVPAVATTTAPALVVQSLHPQQHTPAPVKQVAYLPDKDYVTPLPSSAKQIAEILQANQAVFLKNGTLVAPRENSLKELTPTDFAADICSYITPTIKKVVKHGVEECTQLPTESQSKILMSRISGAESCYIDKIDISSAKPIITKTGISLNSGYHKIDNKGIYISSGGVEHVAIDTAINSIKELVKDFKFLTESDRSRFIAALLTPAFRTAQFFDDPTPMCIAEADAPGAGKTFSQQLIAAVYGETLRIINIEKKGLASLGEILGSAVADGVGFIQIDNCTEDVKSDFLASFLTGEEISIRTAYSRATGIKPQQISLFLTTNGATISKDLIDRSCVSRLRKQPTDYNFNADLLKSVKQNQAHYLGCIHAIFREWINLGMKQSTIKESSHRMRRWAGSIDWILVNILFESPLLNGHGEIQKRCSQSGSIFLRGLIQAAGGEFKNLTPLHLFHLAQGADLNCAGFNFIDVGDTVGSRKIGWVFAQLLGAGLNSAEEEKSIQLDDMILTRHRVRGKSSYSAKLQS